MQPYGVRHNCQLFDRELKNHIKDRTKSVGSASKITKIKMKLYLSLIFKTQFSNEKDIYRIYTCTLYDF